MLLETIKIQNQQIQNLIYHQARFDYYRETLLGLHDTIDLSQHIPIPKDQGCYKCRILYQKDIQKVEILPYQIRPIKSLQLVVADDLQYRFKYADRSSLEALFAQKGEADDILIVMHDWITDTSYSNIVFWDGDDWITPDRPLLKGTKRMKYIIEERIYQYPITVDDLHKYEGAKLINAMMDLEDTEMIAIENIKKALC